MTTSRTASASNMTASRGSRVARLAALAAPLAFAVAASTARTARADDKCPPGSWFCVDAEIKIGPTDAPPPPAPIPAPAPPPVVVPAPAPAPPPPVVIYQPAPPPVYAPAPPPPSYVPPRGYPRERWNSETSISIRLDAAALGGSDNSHGNTPGMGGLGVSLRFRPTPHIGVELGIDGLGGTDSNGYKRRETGLSAIGLVYLNPRSATQLYLLGGFGFSGASVDVESRNYTTTREDYSYFGVIFGGGLEVRASRKVAFNFDIRGFVRGRTDADATYHPEFTAADGRTTNTSGGALLTAGTTFFF